MDSIVFMTIVTMFYYDDKNSIVIMMSIIGRTFFELLFEARVRYLFSYAPFYISLGSLGFEKVFSKETNLKGEK